MLTAANLFITILTEILQPTCVTQIYYILNRIKSIGIYVRRIYNGGEIKEKVIPSSFPLESEPKIDSAWCRIAKTISKIASRYN